MRCFIVLLNKGGGRAGPEGNLGHGWEHVWANKLCLRDFLLRKLFVKVIGEKLNCSGALPGQCQPPVEVSGHFSSHHICSSTFQVIKLAYSLLFNVRISVLKEISLSVCLSAFIDNFMRLEICLTYHLGSWELKRVIPSGSRLWVLALMSNILKDACCSHHCQARSTGREQQISAETHLNEFLSPFSSGESNYWVTRGAELDDTNQGHKSPS